MVLPATRLGRGPSAFRPTGERGWLVHLLASPAGFTILEAIVAAGVVGMAGVGVLMMFGTGQTYVQSSGMDRISAQLAQQRIEQVRAAGYGTTPDPRKELSMTAIPGNPGFERGTDITEVCPSNFAVAWNDGSCVKSPNDAPAKLVVVTVRALNGNGSEPDPQTTPAVMQTVLVRR